MRKIASIQFGSHLYGTNTPTSDTDIKSIHLPSAEDILLQRVQDCVTDKRVKVEGEKNNPDDVDDTSYSLQRYFELLAKGEVMALDMLFAPDDKLLFTTPLWEKIRRCAPLFLSKRSVAFVGYCRQQANKYGIKGSRVSAAEYAYKGFQKAYEDHGAVAKVREFIPFMTGLIKSNPEHILFVEEHNRQGGVDEFISVCNRKVNFNNTVKQAAEVFGKIYDNYGARARQAQQNEGIDWKALSHAVRVGDEALELLSTEKITFPLVRAEYIKAIKLGQLPYGEVSEVIEKLLEDVEAAAIVSELPDSPNTIAMDVIVEMEHRGIILGG